MSAATPTAVTWQSPAWVRRHCSTWCDIQTSELPWTYTRIWDWRIPRRNLRDWKNSIRPKPRWRKQLVRSWWNRICSKRFKTKPGADFQVSSGFCFVNEIYLVTKLGETSIFIWDIHICISIFNILSFFHWF